MSIARASALRRLHSSLRHAGARATPRVSAQARTQLSVGRRFASEGGGGGGGGHAAPGSDMPWLLTALAITPVTCWYLWPTTSHADSGHADAHHGHEDETHEGADEAVEEKESGDAGDAQSEGGESEGEGESAPTDESAESAPQDTSKEQEEAKESEETAKPSGSEGESQPNPPDANKESSGQEDAEPTDRPEGKTDVNFKGGIKDDSPGADDTRKREPDSKGAFKKRIDSGLRKDLGQGPEFADEEGDSPRREAAVSSKTPQKGSEGDITGKQFGLSNTPTKHSLQIDQDPEKSKKGEGTPETAKSMGTVDPNRPQV